MSEFPREQFEPLVDAVAVVTYEQTYGTFPQIPVDPKTGFRVMTPEQIRERVALNVANTAPKLRRRVLAELAALNGGYLPGDGSTIYLPGDGYDEPLTPGELPDRSNEVKGRDADPADGFA